MSMQPGTGPQGLEVGRATRALGPGRWTERAAALLLDGAAVVLFAWLGRGAHEGGRSLAVDPTPWARLSGMVGEATAWAQLVASEPEAGSRTMRDQFDCHALGATDKATWNLEPWRPDVGFLATAAARCNPTG